MSDHPHGGGGPGRWGMPDRPRSKNLSYLKRTWSFMQPYTKQLVFAGTALVFTSMATLSIGVGLKFLIDRGLSAGDATFLNLGFLVLLGIILVIATGTYARFYYISWVGERVVA
ncbi:MAG: hypothetical protein JNM81_03950, partial [Rhodospirillaceae bacterium]|nr:hypothetical protein [Rhodospirillaceae bacterium]